MNNENKIDEALMEFVAEGEEILQRVSLSLQKIEKEKCTPELIGGVYRDMHTLKGTAQLFGFQEIGKLAHALEASMDPIRKLNLEIPPRLLDASFRSLDLLDRMLKSVREKQNDSGFGSELLKWVTQLADAATDQFKAELNVTKDFLLAPESKFSAGDSPTASAGKKLSSQESQTVLGKGTFVEQLSTTDSLVRAEDRSTMDDKKAAGAGVANSNAAAVDPADASIRVQVALLDRLMNLVGELVLVRNQFLQYRNQNEEADFVNMSKTLDVVTSELQGEVMKTRMQPIGNVVTKFQRVVRDMAKELGKKIDLTLEGVDTELDKTLLEAIKDPMTHLVRNSCDHGVESPAERKKAGKPETGHLLIRSFHEGGQVVVEISDDGKGLDRTRIVSKAIERGLITAEAAAKLQDREVCNMIFLPGFSTAKEVSAISGRGVGMDVVKTNIEKIGGSVELASVQGKGTTIRLKIPLTLAIVPAMLVRSGKEKFAIPQVKLVELVRIEAGSEHRKIEFLQGKPMFRLRGSLLALVDIDEVMGRPSTRNYSEDVYVVVLNAEGEVFGLIVDEILDTADIVVKPLSSFLKYIQILSGATIMGDGSISLILDVVGLAQAAAIDTKKDHTDAQAFLQGAMATKKSFDAQEFLLLDVGTEVPHAVPLCLVHRLEEFKAKEIEKSGEQRVVRYRGALLPIISLKSALGYKKTDDQEKRKDFISVVVVQKSGRSFGVEVAEIMDVVTVEDQIDDTVTDRPGLLGNIIIDQSVVVVVDVLTLIDYAVPSLKQGKDPAKSASGFVNKAKESIEAIKMMTRDMKSKKIRVLFAEDVAFFRRHVVKVLTEAGMDITTVEDGAKALELLETSPEGQFNLILSDIEMPKMTGLEFAREVRKRDKFRHIPMIALTTRFRDKDIQDGKDAGFNVYLEKLNPEKLLNAIDGVMGGEGKA